MGDAWGPMVEHDGKGCPVVGQYVRAWCADGYVSEALVGPTAARPRVGHHSLWIWRTVPRLDWPLRIVRYRVRRPRGMEVIEKLLAQLPADPPGGDGDAPAPRSPKPAAPDDAEIDF